MLSNVALVAFFAAASYAVPLEARTSCQRRGTGNGTSNSTQPSSSTSSPQQPFSFPLSNGFPNISIPSSALTAIEQAAHGTLPNTPLPTSISNASYTTWNLIAFNELFEVAFFTSLINNITSGVYPTSDPTLLTTLQTIQAQEELHALGANAILTSAKRPPTQPCEYIFPTDNLDDALALASAFTDLVLGTLQDALLSLRQDSNGTFLPLIGSVIGQEGEQNGFYRLQSPNTKSFPSALPFLTRSASSLLYAFLEQNFIVPGSCPGASATRIAQGGLTPAISTLQPVDQVLEYTFMNNGTDPSTLGVVFINQQNVPIVQDMETVTTVEGTNQTSFSAYFPYTENEMNGLTIVAITSSKGPFENAEEVAEATIFGPGLVEVN